MTASQGRILIYAVFGVASMALVGLVRWHGDVDDAPLLLQLATAGMGVAWVVFIVVDVVVHTLHGKGVPCPHCGEKRQLPSFRLAGPCPKCGQ